MGDPMNDTTLYYIAMVVIYSGLLPWVVSQLTRSRADERQAARDEIQETLTLTEKLRTARAAATDPARQASYDAMINRLTAEANQQVSDLNAVAAEEGMRPANRYVVIPSPKSAWGAILTVVFAGAVYFAIMFLLTIAFDFWNDPTFDVLNDRQDQQRTLFLLGGSALLVSLAFLTRFMAFRSYDRAMERLRRDMELAEQKPA